MQCYSIGVLYIATVSTKVQSKYAYVQYTYAHTHSHTLTHIIKYCNSIYESIEKICLCTVHIYTHNLPPPSPPRPPPPGNRVHHYQPGGVQRDSEQCHLTSDRVVALPLAALGLQYPPQEEEKEIPRSHAPQSGADGRMPDHADRGAALLCGREARRPRVDGAARGQAAVGACGRVRQVLQDQGGHSQRW